MQKNTSYLFYPCYSYEFDKISLIPRPFKQILLKWTEFRLAALSYCQIKVLNNCFNSFIAKTLFLGVFIELQNYQL